MAVAHHGTPLFPMVVHSLYSVPLYVKGNSHGSLADGLLEDLRLFVRQPKLDHQIFTYFVSIAAIIFHIVHSVKN